ncbi:MAG: hypothetical protein K1000chlam2_01283 [Chlamydiae bacterium]|nr:hypothetical protein [Chlamydiota bacterium]
MKKKNEVKLAEKKMELEDRLNQELIKETVGVNDYDFACSLITSASNALEPFLGEEEGLKTVMQSFRNLKPRDSMEARMIGQSVILFEYAMKCFRQCGNADGFSPAEATANLGIKLMRVHNETVETLSRYRRGGEQKITVSHAVLANQITNNYGEGVSPQNRGDTSCPQENAEPKQRPTTISHVDSPQWPMEDADSTAAKAPARGRKKGSKM